MQSSAPDYKKHRLDTGALESARWDLHKGINERAFIVYTRRHHKTDNDARNASAALRNVRLFQGNGNAAERRASALLGVACDECGVRGGKHQFYCGARY
jgi:hypothetical protein